LMGVAIMMIALILTGVGLAMPWWTNIDDSGEYPTVAEASLWVNVITTYAAPEETVHYGCSGPCDRTMNGKIRVVTQCESWEELCSAARFACDFPQEQALLDERENALVAAAAAAEDTGSVPTALPSFPPAPTPPPVPFLSPPTLPPVDLSEEEKEATSTKVFTTTFTSTLTSTSTSFTTHTTPPLTVYPGTTRPFLRPNECPMMMNDEFVAAEYTEWELAWSLQYKTVVGLYQSLNRAMAQIPARLFAQRPTMIEQVRLVWEAFVERSTYPNWLWQYGKNWCPSAPAESLHYWLTLPENKWTLDLVQQALIPPDVIHFRADVCRDDSCMKEAWEAQTGVLFTTHAPLLEEGSGAAAAYQAQYATTTLPNIKFSEDVDVAVQETSSNGISLAPSMSFATCQKARSEGGEALEQWHEGLNPCDVGETCNKLWAVRFGLFLHILLGLIHSAPSCLSFISSGQRFASRVPPQVEFLCALCSAGVLTVAIAIAVYIGIPDKSDGGLDIRGPGFNCTVAAMLLCLASAGLASMAKGAAEAEEVIALQVPEAPRINSAPSDVRITKNLRDFPEAKPAVQVSAGTGHLAIAASPAAPALALPSPGTPLRSPPKLAWSPSHGPSATLDAATLQHALEQGGSAAPSLGSTLAVQRQASTETVKPHQERIGGGV